MPKKKKVAKKAVKKIVKKPGVGRPKGSGKYGCETRVVRVPAHMVDDVVAYALKKVK